MPKRKLWFLHFKVMLRVRWMLSKKFCVYGYNNIPIPKNRMCHCRPLLILTAINCWIKFGDYLASNGFNEILSNSLLKVVILNSPDGMWNRMWKFSIPKPCDLEILRRNMLYTGLEAQNTTETVSIQICVCLNSEKRIPKKIQNTKSSTICHYSSVVEKGRKMERRYFSCKVLFSQIIRWEFASGSGGVGSSNLKQKFMLIHFFASGLQIKTGNKYWWLWKY